MTSCSFRITRTAEDLAQTMTALSQRLVNLEERLECIERDLGSSKPELEPPAEEMQMLDGVDQLLRECNELLTRSSSNDDTEKVWPDQQQSEQFAA